MRTKPHRRRRLRQRLPLPMVWKFKLFMLLTGCTLFLFVALGAGSLPQAKLFLLPAKSMRGIAAETDSRFFLDMLALESHALPKRADKEGYSFSARNVTQFLFRFLTDINPKDPRSLLAIGIPLMPRHDPVLLARGSGGENPPRDYAPDDRALPGGEPVERPASDTIDMDALIRVVDNSRHAPKPQPIDIRPDMAVPVSLTNKHRVFIYHTHPRESFLPELPGVKDSNEANHATLNVTILGRRMQENFAKIGISALHSDQDYYSTIKDYNWNRSYEYSEKTVTQALSQYPELDYFFDIHRDSQSRELTTATIDGIAYAQVYFVVGQGNPNWRKNEAFAAKINEVLERDYPGLSRGVYGKDKSTGNGEYNQSVSPNSILIEIGGVENTLEEAGRTVDILTRVIAEVLIEAETAGKQSETDPVKS